MEQLHVSKTQILISTNSAEDWSAEFRQQRDLSSKEVVLTRRICGHKLLAPKSVKRPICPGLEAN